MTLGEAVKTRLLAITPLTALVDTRVYELTLPQNERRAAVRLQAMGIPRPTHIRGPVNHFAQRVQVDSYVPLGSSDPLAEVREIAAAVQGDGLGSGLAGWSGIIGGSPDEPIHIFDVHVASDGDEIYEDDEQLRVRRRLDYMVHWRVMTDE